MGGHVKVCSECGHEDIAYNSCRNRHCPKCQGPAQAAWLEARCQDLLDVPYHHVVFTLPRELSALALGNKRILYGILFAAASETLLQIAADPKHLGARIGFIALLHTWGQKLEHHPHVHCVVPGGGLSEDQSQWVACQPGFFLPIKILSKVYRGKFLERLRTAYDQGQLRFGGSTAPLVDPGNFAALVRQCYKTDWIVYCKPPFGGPEIVLRYLARYTHRVAISNSRLRSFEDDRVTFSWKDYASGSVRRELSLPALEFIRRFLLHVLPRGFVRIRHYGFLANRCRAQLVQLCRELIGQPPPSELVDREDDHIPCPACGKGRLIKIHELPAPSLPQPRVLVPT